MAELQVDLLFNAKADSAVTQISNIQTALQNVKNVANDGIGKQINTDFQEATKVADQLQQAFANAFNQDTGKLNLARLNADLKATGMSTDQIKNAFQQLGPTGEKAMQEMCVAIVSAEKPVLSLGKHVENLITNFAKTAQMRLSNSICSGLESGLKSTIDFAKTLSNSLGTIQMISGKSDQAMKGIAETSIQAAQNLSVASEDYLKASETFYRQGLDSEQVTERTAAAIQLSQVTGETVNQTSDALTAMIANFDVGAKGISYYGDVVTKLGSETAASSAEITDAMEKFASTAGTVQFSFENASSAIATISANTRESAEKIGTGMKTILARITSLQQGKDTDDTTFTKYTEALENVGVQVTDQEGQLRSVDDIIDDIGKKWQALTNTQKQSLANTVAGVRQIDVFEGLFNNFSDYQDNIDKAKDATGTLEEQAERYANTWEGAQKRLQAAGEYVKSELFDPKSLVQIINVVADFTNQVGNAVKHLGGLKGILGMIAPILAQVFSVKLPELLASATQKIGDLGLISTKKFKEMQFSATKYLSDIGKNKSKNLEEGSSDSAEDDAHIVGLSKIAELKSQIMDKDGKLSKEAQVLLAIQKQQNAVLEEQAKKLETAAKTAESYKKALEDARKASAAIANAPSESSKDGGKAISKDSAGGATDPGVKSSVESIAHSVDSLVASGTSISTSIGQLSQSNSAINTNTSTIANKLNDIQTTNSQISTAINMASNKLDSLSIAISNTGQNSSAPATSAEANTSESSNSVANIGLQAMSLSNESILSLIAQLGSLLEAQASLFIQSIEPVLVDDICNIEDMSSNDITTAVKENSFNYTDVLNAILAKVGGAKSDDNPSGEEGGADTTGGSGKTSPEGSPPTPSSDSSGGTESDEDDGSFINEEDGAMIGATVGALEQLNEDMTQVQGAFDNGKASVDEYSAAMENIFKLSTQYYEGTEEGKQAIQSSAAEMKKLEKSYNCGAISLEEFHNSANNIQKTVGGHLNQALQKSTKSLQKFEKQEKKLNVDKHLDLSAAVQSFKNMGKQSVKAGEGLNDAGKSAKNIKNVFGAAKEAVSGLGVTAAQTATKTIGNMGAMKTSTQAVSSAFREWSDGSADLATKVTGTVTALTAMGSSVMGLVNQGKDIGSTFGKLKQVMGEHKKAQEDDKKAVDDAQDSVEALKKAREEEGQSAQKQAQNAEGEGNAQKAGSVGAKINEGAHWGLKTAADAANIALGGILQIIGLIVSAVSAIVNVVKTFTHVADSAKVARGELEPLSDSVDAVSESTKKISGTSVEAVTEDFKTMNDTMKQAASGEAISEEQFDSITALDDNYKQFFKTNEDGSKTFIGSQQDMAKMQSDLAKSEIDKLDERTEANKKLKDTIANSAELQSIDLEGVGNGTADEDQQERARNIFAFTDAGNQALADSGMSDKEIEQFKRDIENYDSLTEEEKAKMDESVQALSERLAASQTEDAEEIEKAKEKTRVSLAMSAENLEALDQLKAQSDESKDNTISDNAYQQGLINLGEKYTNCSDSVAAYQEALESGTEAQKQAAEAQLKADMAMGEAGEQYGVEADRVEMLARSLAGSDEEYEKNSKALAMQAAQSIAANDALIAMSNATEDYTAVGDALQSVGEGNTKAFLQQVASSEKLSKAYDDMKTNTAALTGVSKKYLSDDFMTKHMKDIQAAAKGDEEAIKKVQSAAKKEMILNLNKGTALEGLDEVADKLANLPEGKIDLTSDNGQALQSFVDAQMAAGKTGEEIEKALSGIGVSIDLEDATQQFDDFEKASQYAAEMAAKGFSISPDKITETEVPIEDPNPTPDTTTEIVENGSEPVYYPRPDDENPTNGIYTFIQGLKTEILYPKYKTQTKTEQKKEPQTKKVFTVPAFTMKDGATASGPAKIATETLNTAKNNSSKSSGGGGGGGGGSSSSKSSGSKKSSSGIRYHGVTRSIGSKSNAKALLASKREAVAGKAKIQLLDKEIDKQEEINELNQKYYKEAEKYLALDKEKVKNLGAEFDDLTGEISNYEKLLNSLNEEYNKLVDQEASEDAISAMEEKITKVQEAFDEYEGTLDTKMEVEATLQEDSQTLLQQQLDKISLGIELKTEFSDADFSFIDNLMSRLELFPSNFSSSITLLTRKLADSFAIVSANYSGLKDIFKNANLKLDLDDTSKDSLLDSFFSGDSKALEKIFSNITNIGSLEKDKMMEIVSALEDNLSTILEIIDTVNTSFIDLWNEYSENIDTAASQMESFSSVTASYLDIIDTIGAKQFFIKDDTVLAFYKNIRDNGYQQLSTDVTKLNTLKNTYEKFKNEYQALLENNQIPAEAKKQLEDQMTEIKSSIIELRNTCIDDFKTAYEQAMQWIQQENSLLRTQLEKDFYNSEKTIEQLQDTITRQDNLNKLYLTNSETFFAISKLSNTINKDLLKITNVKTQNALKQFNDAILARKKSGIQLSQQEADLMQKQYDLLKARLELENSSSSIQVMLQRNALGEMGYTYVEDSQSEEKRLQAQANYYSKLQDMQKTTLAALDTNDKEITDIQKNLADTIIKIQDDTNLSEIEKEIQIEEEYDAAKKRIAAIAERSKNLIKDTNEAIQEGIDKGLDIALINYAERSIPYAAGITSLDEWESKTQSAVDNYLAEYSKKQNEFTDSIQQAFKLLGFDPDNVDGSLITALQNSQSDYTGAVQDTTLAMQDFNKTLDSASETFAKFYQDYGVKITESLNKIDTVSALSVEALKKINGVEKDFSTSSALDLLNELFSSVQNNQAQSTDLSVSEVFSGLSKTNPSENLSKDSSITLPTILEDNLTGKISMLQCDIDNITTKLITRIDNTASQIISSVDSGITKGLEIIRDKFSSISQTVNITADFPSANDAEEIKLALQGLSLNALNYEMN